MPATLTTFSYTNDNISDDTFWAGFRSYLDYFPNNAAAGTYSYFFILPDSSGGITFLMQPFFGPNKTVAQSKELCSPGSPTSLD